MSATNIDTQAAREEAQQLYELARQCVATLHELLPVITHKPPGKSKRRAPWGAYKLNSQLIHVSHAVKNLLDVLEGQPRWWKKSTPTVPSGPDAKVIQLFKRSESGPFAGGPET